MVFEDIFLRGKLPEQALEAIFYRQMRTIRVVEERLLALFSEGLVRGTVHTCLGQEACAVGVVNALDHPGDVLCSNHRGHGHFLGFTGNVEGLIAEILGLASGVCAGIGGSQHLHQGNYYSNGILGGMPPIATGMAMAAKLDGAGAVVCVFLGDGAMAEGSVYEALNMAGLWRLPILFVVEHNRYAQSTHWSRQHAGSLDLRAENFGVPVVSVDGNDVMAVYQATRTSLASLRAGHGPAMLFLDTYRLGPHSKGDDNRAEDELRRHWRDEPLARLRNEYLDAERCAEMDAELAVRIDALVSGLRERAARR